MIIMMMNNNNYNLCGNTMTRITKTPYNVRYTYGSTLRNTVTVIYM